MYETKPEDLTISTSVLLPRRRPVSEHCITPGFETPIWRRQSHGTAARPHGRVIDRRNYSRDTDDRAQTDGADDGAGSHHFRWAR